MPQTILGIGTQFIGKRDFGTDRSFVTTEFRVAAIPLYPLRSVRVIEGPSSTEYHFFSQTWHTNYKVLAEGKVNLRQSIYAYGFAALYMAYLIGLVIVGPPSLGTQRSILDPRWILQFAVFLLPLIIPVTMRLVAKRRTSRAIMESCPCGSSLPYSACCRPRTEAMKEKERNFYKTFI
jgi:hypothetical protein